MSLTDADLSLESVESINVSTSSIARFGLSSNPCLANAGLIESRAAGRSQGVRENLDLRTDGPLEPMEIMGQTSREGNAQRGPREQSPG